MGWMLRHPHGPSRRAPGSGRPEWSTLGQPWFPGASVPPQSSLRTCCPALRGRARLWSQGLLFEFVMLVRGALGRPEPGPIAQLARARA